MKKVRLKDILSSLESGKRPKGGAQDNAEIPSFGGGQLNADGGFDFDGMPKVPLEFYNSLNRGIIKNKDILIVKDGATTGKVSLVRENFPYKKAAINEHLYKLSDR